MKIRDLLKVELSSDLKYKLNNDFYKEITKLIDKLEFHFYTAESYVFTDYKLYLEIRKDMSIEFTTNINIIGKTIRPMRKNKKISEKILDYCYNKAFNN